VTPTDQFQTLQPRPIPNGSAWAALVSAGIGALGFGILTDLSECSARAAKLLLWYRPAGSLSGVAAGAILFWIAAWAVLQMMWKNRRLEHQRTLLAVIIALSLAALVTTFPPFYELLGG
jgi:hypothetical protein